jgi:small-conductance mechanosensitive channel
MVLTTNRPGINTTRLNDCLSVRSRGVFNALVDLRGRMLELLFFIVVLVLPLALLVAMGRDLTQKRPDSKHGVWLLTVSASLLAVSVVWGYVGRHQSMAEGMRTAASLAYSAMFVRSLLIVVVSGMVKHRLASDKHRSQATPPKGPPFFD